MEQVSTMVVLTLNLQNLNAKNDTDIQLSFLLVYFDDGFEFDTTDIN